MNADPDTETNEKRIQSIRIRKRSNGQFIGLSGSSAVDPHWFQCGFESSFLSKCGSESREPSNTDTDPDLDPGQTLKSQKLEFLHEKCTVGTSSRYGTLPIGQKTDLRRYKSSFVLILVNFYAPGSGYAFSQYGSGSSRIGRLGKQYLNAGHGAGHVEV
jgi:hypothetical protein